MIDRNQVIQMMDGDELLAEKLISSFCSEVKKQLPLLNDYLRNNNRKLFSNGVHNIKSQAAYLGLQDIAELSNLIEIHADSGLPLDTIIQNFLQLEKRLIEIIKMI